MATFACPKCGTSRPHCESPCSECDWQPGPMTSPTIWTPKRTQSTIYGLVVGGGLGLLSCDWMDLRGGDGRALYGWMTGILFGLVIGGAVGWSRPDQPAERFHGESRSKIAGRWLQGIGALLLCHGIMGLIMRPTPGNAPLMIWTATMVSAGIGYLIAGALLPRRDCPSEDRS